MSSYEKAKADYERQLRIDAWVDRVLYLCFGAAAAVIAMAVL